MSGKWDVCSVNMRKDGFGTRLRCAEVSCLVTLPIRFQPACFFSFLTRLYVPQKLGPERAVWHPGQVLRQLLTTAFRVNLAPGGRSVVGSAFQDTVPRSQDHLALVIFLFFVACAH